jgi:hypothetical protein
MAAVELVGAVGRDQDDPLVPQTTSDERQQIPRRAVGPVDVLDDEHHRLALAQALEQDEETIEQARLGPLGRRLGAGLGAAGDELGDEPTELPRRRVDQAGEDGGVRDPEEAAKRLGDRGERQSLLRAQADASAVEHEAARVTGAVRELTDEAALADSRLPADENDGRRAAFGPFERCLERAHLGHPADQDRARESGAHLGADHTIGPGAQRLRSPTAGGWSSPQSATSIGHGPTALARLAGSQSARRAASERARPMASWPASAAARFATAWETAASARRTAGSPTWPARRARTAWSVRVS